MTDEPVTTPEEERDGLVRVRLDLAYEGTDFSGWARQPQRRTVQATLEQALAQVLRLAAPPRTTVAGRTDAGVHATGQVVHVDVAAGQLGPAGGPARLLRRLNGVLPPDVRVHGAAAAPDGFDARFGALSRRYRYRLCDGICHPLRRRDTLSVHRLLDTEAMSRAARELLGQHDFAAYCRCRPGASSVRELQGFTWKREPEGGEGLSTGGVLVADLLADGFCHSMVRALVGACLAVGEGRRPESWPAQVLAGRVRDPGVLVAAAHGLTLVGVDYPELGGLAARAALTRRHRPPLPGDGAAGV